MSTTTTTITENEDTEDTATPAADVETEDQTTTDTGPETVEPSGDESGNREAAKYRRKLREAETERDGLRATVETMQRAEVERLAAATLTTPAGLWASGVELSSLLDKDGQVDPARVREAATAAVEALGLAKPRPANHVPREGNIPAPPREDTWTKAFTAN